MSDPEPSPDKLAPFPRAVLILLAGSLIALIIILTIGAFVGDDVPSELGPDVPGETIGQ